MNKRFMDLFNLKGKTALVTGGGTGMGKEFAWILAEAGATVTIAARNEERLSRAAKEISDATGATVYTRKVDLADRGAAANLITDAQQQMDGLDILICNGAIDMYASVAEFNDDEYDALLAVNFTSNVWMTRAAIPHMKKNQWGRIIYITSITSEMSLRNVGIGAYAATKCALEGYARFAGAELGTQGITVNCLAPGAVRTEMSDVLLKSAGASQEQINAILDYQSSLNTLNRWARPGEIAPALLLLASDAGSYINGTRYLVDGGWQSMGDTIQQT